MSLTENMTQPLQMIFFYKERNVDINFDISVCRNVHTHKIFKAEKSNCRGILGGWGHKCSFSEQKLSL